jgi:hypothetical protein
MRLRKWSGIPATEMVGRKPIFRWRTFTTEVIRTRGIQRALLPKPAWEAIWLLKEFDVLSSRQKTKPKSLILEP